MSSPVCARRRLLAISRHAMLTGSALCLAWVAPAVAQPPAPIASASARNFNIPAQSLRSALRQMMRQGNVQIGFEAADVDGKLSSAVTGNMSANEALSRLLSGTGLSYRYLTSGSVMLEQAPHVSDGTVHLGTVRVQGSQDNIVSDTAGHNGRVAGWDGTKDSVFRTPGSVNVITRETLEAYPATAPADMLRGTPGVIAGEARTSGGLDVNIRGLQGQGRVPVTVDGAINGTTVYRGYQGTSNRSFVDPDFVSHVAIVKGPSNGNAIAGGIGGSISMSTLGVDDIVPTGDTMAIRIKASLSNNNVEPGSNMIRSIIQPNHFYGDTMAATRERARPGLFSPAGGSASLVFARKGEAIDIVAGYSMRRMGNYFAGRQGKYAPRETGTPSPLCAAGTPETQIQQLCDRAIAFYDIHGSTPFAGGEEVYNTSSDVESTLVKVAVRPADDHVLELGYGGYWSIFGENYPGSLGSATVAVFQNHILSKTSLDRFTARYRWNPQGDLIDLKLNGWISKLKESAPSIFNSDVSRRYVDSWGTDLTNSSQILTPIGLFAAEYGASFLHEKAGPDGKWTPAFEIPPGREGTRSEYSLFTDMTLEPIDWLRIQAGARYQEYSLKDQQSGRYFYSELLKRGEDAFNYSLGATLMPAEGVQVFANYKKAARLPSLMEATSGFFYIANPDLHKEVTRNWEIGANYARTGLLTDKDELGLKLAWFDNDVDGYIARRYILQRGSMQMYNIDRAMFRGLEGSLSYNNGGLRVEAGATYYDRIRFCRPDSACIASTLASDFATNYIPPRWAANLSVNQTFLDERATLGARLTYMGKRPIGAEKPTTGYMPLISQITWHPYVLADMTGSFRLNDGVSFNWSIDNLTDRYYNEPMSLGYVPAPGRTFRIGVTSTIGSKNGMWPANWFAKSGNADPVDWTGPYVGGQIGYGFGQTKGTITNSAGNPADLENGSRYQEKLNNMLGGLHAGFNYQLPSRIVLGVEADISAGDLGNWSGVLVQQTENDGYNIAALRGKGTLESDTRYKWDRLITLRGRVGYSLGQTLLYGTGGIGWVRETQTRNQYRSGPTSNANEKGIGGELEHYFFEKDRKNRTGLVLGAGVERDIGKRWSLRAEYSYARFQKKQFSFANARAGAGLDYGYYETVGWQEIPAQTIIWDDGTVFEFPAYTAPVTEYREVTGTSTLVEGRKHRGDADMHSLRIGISYRF